MAVVDIQLPKRPDIFLYPLEYLKSIFDFRKKDIFYLEDARTFKNDALQSSNLSPIESYIFLHFNTIKS